MLPWLCHTVHHLAPFLRVITPAKFKKYRCYIFKDYFFDFVIHLPVAPLITLSQLCLRENSNITDKEKKKNAKWKRLFFITLKTLSNNALITGVSFYFIGTNCKKYMYIKKLMLRKLNCKHTNPNFNFIFSSTMTNEGFKEYVNGNMLFWAANVKSTEGYRGQ